MILKNIFKERSNIVLPGITLILSFFIISLAVDEICYSLNSSLKPALPIDIDKHLVVLMDFNRGDVSSNKAILAKKIQNIQIQEAIKREVKRLSFISKSTYLVDPIDRVCYGGDDFRNDTFTGIRCDSDFSKVFNLNMVEGRWFQDGDVDKFNIPVVISALHAQHLGIDHLTSQSFFNFQDRDKSYRLKVVGIVQGMENMVDGTMPFFVPISTGRGVVVPPQLILKIKDEIDLRDAKEKLSKLFEEQGWDKYLYKFQVDTLEDILYQKLIEGIKFHSIHYGIILMMLCSIGVILFGSSWRQVKDRITEIGIYRAVGATKREIVIHFLVEKLILLLLILMIVVPIYLNLYSLFEIEYLVITPLVSIGLMLLAVLVATFIPALYASTIHPVKALSDE